MTQRNPLNERYNSPDEKRTGKTRKSSASAKPKTQLAGTIREPAPKTKKQKREEARERERKAAQKASMAQSLFEDTPTYKSLRRGWWIALGSAVVFTALSFWLQQNPDFRQVSMVLMVLAYGAIIFAFYIDFGKIRKERKLHNATVVASKSKEARKEQKRLRAEQRAQEKEAAEKFEAAKAEEAEKAAKGGFLARFRKGGASDADKASAEETPQDKDSQKN